MLSSSITTSGPVRAHQGQQALPVQFDIDPESFWGRLQKLNHEQTIQLGIAQVEEAGNLDNLRLAAGREARAPGAAFRGKMFADSDVYKVLEAVAWERARNDTPDLAAWESQTTELIAAAQHADGYINSYTQVNAIERYSDLERGHELYCAGHLIQAAVAQSRSTGTDALLQVAIRLADHIDETFRPGGIESTDGHPEIETALVELYRETRDERHLAAAKRLTDARGAGRLRTTVYDSSYFLDDLPVRDTHFIHGHAVRALYLLAGVIDIAVETDDAELLQVARDQYADLLARRSYITGGVGSRWTGEAIGDPFELPPDRSYSETCAAIASVQAAWRLSLATGDAVYDDAIERTLYNGFLAGMAESGTEFFYNNSLHVRHTDHRAHHRQPQLGRSRWFRTACCPPNIMRMIASFGHYIASVNSHGLSLHQLVAGTTVTERLSLRVSGDVLAGADIKIDVLDAADGPHALAIRIPAWAENGAGVGAPDLLISSGSRSIDRARDGSWLILTGDWHAGDAVSLRLPSAPRLVWPSPSIDAVRGTCAVAIGPLILCLDQEVQTAGLDVERFRVNPADVTMTPSTADVWGGVPAAQITGLLAADAPVPASPYSDERPTEALAPATAVAIPYFAWGNHGVSAMRVFIPLAE